jgi:hypothetical protein
MSFSPCALQDGFRTKGVRCQLPISLLRPLPPTASSTCPLPELRCEFSLTIFPHALPSLTRLYSNPARSQVNSPLPHLLPEICDAIITYAFGDRAILLMPQSESHRTSSLPNDLLILPYTAEIIELWLLSDHFWSILSPKHASARFKMRPRFFPISRASSTC